MKVPRVSVSWMLVLVAVVAVNLAVGRAFSNSMWFCGAGLTVVALQAGGLRLIRSKGRVRLFWVGFVVTLSGALLSLGWVIPYLRLNDPRPNSTLGQIVYQTWLSYLNFGFRVVRPIFRPWTAQNRSRSSQDFARCLKWAVVFFLPQFAAAVAGGLLFRQIHRWLGTRQVHAPPAPNDGPA